MSTVVALFLEGLPFLEYLSLKQVSLASKLFSYLCGYSLVSLRIRRAHKCHFVQSCFLFSNSHSALWHVSNGYLDLLFKSYIVQPSVYICPSSAQLCWCMSIGVHNNVMNRKFDISLTGKECSQLEDREQTAEFVFLPHFLMYCQSQF